jgi:uncharacterized protein YyaL (SSP411 family)
MTNTKEEATSPFKVGDVVAVISTYGYGSTPRTLVKGTVSKVTKRFVEVTSSKSRTYRMNPQGTDVYPRPHTWSSVSQGIEPWAEKHLLEIQAHNAQRFIKGLIDDKSLTDKEALAIQALLLKMRASESGNQ